MATTTEKSTSTKKQRGKASSSRSSSRASSKSSSSSRGATKKKPAAKGGSKAKQPGFAVRMLAAAKEHVGDQSNDVYGIALILAGVLLGMALYFQVAGPVGDFAEAVFRGLLGVFGYIVPPLLVYFGFSVVLDREGAERGRVTVGIALLLIAVVGGWHLFQGAPEPADGWKELWPAGGAFGWAVSRPMVVALSIWGASAVLAALFVLGLLIVTKTPFRAIWDFVSGLFDGAREELGRESEPESKAEGASTEDDDERATTLKAERALARATGGEADTDTVVAKRPRRRQAPDPVEGEQQAIPGTRGAAAEVAEAAATETPAADAAPAPGVGLTAADREAGRAPSPPKPEVPKAARAVLDGGTVETTADGKRKAKKVLPRANWDDYELPPLDLLAKGRAVGTDATRHIEASVAALQETFDQFGIDATVARHSRGPTVTRFEIELGPGVQVRKVANMGDDIAYALAAPDVRIVAPIPGKSAIGVEVPNRERDLITLRDILVSDVAKADPHPMLVALGVDIAGNPAMVNLVTMPHLLISGATGSGKSVTMNAMVASVICRARPDQVRMILIDPKRVELNAYEGAPHLLSPVVADPRRATDALQWAVKEMEMRYETLARLGFRNIDGYNDAVAAGNVPAATEEERDAYGHMPYILLVIDELSDLMMVAPRDVEDAICRIAQMARAVGIHMLIATQRPSVDVITGLIKANIPSRLALAVASQTDSRTILDMGGAEKLVGNGDMLFMPASQGKPSRLQGCFTGETEIRALVEFCRRQRDAEYIDGVVKSGEDAAKADATRGGDDDSDEGLVRRAAELVVRSGLGSTSMLQRKLRIGFARAGRVMDELETLGVVGPNEGSKARDVLWTEEHLENAQQDGTFDLLDLG